VVIATGLTYFRHIPDLLSNLPSDKISHSADARDFERFWGQRVAVLGGGASAIDIAVLLNEAVGNVQLISRKPAIIFSGRWGGSGAHWFLRPLVRPVSGIGPGNIGCSRSCLGYFAAFPSFIDLGQQKNSPQRPQGSR
jgi:cation diffusion facilitator CzcD-associated flavoprotein CzcO